MRIIEVGGGVDLCPAPLWMPAYAGMTANVAGMTVDYAGLMVVFAGMTLIGGMTLDSGYGT